MKISEIARKADVSTDTVRHYVALGLLTPTRNPDNGYQLFSKRDFSRLRFIREAQSLGFRLEEIQSMFADAKKESSPCPRVRQLITGRLAETRRKIEELTSLCERMEQAMADWQRIPDCVPDGDDVCHLIESRMEP